MSRKKEERHTLENARSNAAHESILRLLADFSCFWPSPEDLAGKEVNAINAKGIFTHPASGKAYMVDYDFYIEVNSVAPIGTNAPAFTLEPRNA